MSRRRIAPVGTRRVFLVLLAAALVVVACSKMSAAPTTAQPKAASTTTQTPDPPFSNVPPDTAAAAAPTNAKHACQYVKAAVATLSSNDKSVDQAVALAQSGADSTLDAAAHDPAYAKLRTDVRGFLVDVVRLQIQLQVEGGVVAASKYPASYRKTLKELRADCS